MTREELLQAWKVMRPWLEESVKDAMLAAGQYQPGKTTLDEVAYRAGIADGMAQAAQLLEGRITETP